MPSCICNIFPTPIVLYKLADKSYICSKCGLSCNPQHLMWDKKYRNLICKCAARMYICTRFNHHCCYNCGNPISSFYCTCKTPIEVKATGTKNYNLTYCSRCHRMIEQS